MPIYDYVCGACGTTTEVVHGIHDVGPRFCPACGAKGRMKKAFAPPTIVFKGSGWAKKDRAGTSTTSRSTDRAASSKQEPTDAASASASRTASDAGAADTPASTASDD